MTNKTVPVKKEWGQNWLVNPGVLDRIAKELTLDPDQTVVEVGPGTGALTQYLAKTKARVIAVEKDRSLIEPLRKMFAAYPNVTIIQGDIMDFRPTDAELTPGTWKLVGNIPYYLTSHLIRLALERWRPSRIVFTVQLEVARRMLEKPPHMNLLALSVQLYAHPSLIMRVSRGSFRPTPEVDSAVVRMDLLPASPAGEREKALALARVAFAHKRKQLKSSILPERLAAAGIEPQSRPQELGIEDWLRLSTTR